MVKIQKRIETTTGKTILGSHWAIGDEVGNNDDYKYSMPTMTGGHHKRARDLAFHSVDDRWLIEARI